MIGKHDKSNGIDVFRVDPPRVEVTEDGKIFRTVAEYRNDQHELLPLGMVATGPGPSGLGVVGNIGTNQVYVAYHETDDVEADCVKDAEELAAAVILRVLGLEKKS